MVKSSMGRIEHSIWIMVAILGVWIFFSAYGWPALVGFALIGLATYWVTRRRSRMRRSA